MCNLFMWRIHITAKKNTYALKNYYNANIFNKVELNIISRNFWQNISKDFKTIRTTYYKNTSNIFPLIANQILESDFLKTDIARLGRHDRSKASENRNKFTKHSTNKL